MFKKYSSISAFMQGYIQTARDRVVWSLWLVWN